MGRAEIFGREFGADLHVRKGRPGLFWHALDAISGSGGQFGSDL